MKRVLTILFIMVVLVSACRPGNTSETPSPTDTPQTGGLPTPIVEVTEVPDVRQAVEAFLTAWQDGDFTAMYEMLNGVSQEAHTLEDLTAVYQDAAYNLTLQSLDYQVLSALTNPTTAQAAYQVTFQTRLLGSFSRDMTMNLVLEAGQWKVQWEEGLILPELTGGNHLSLDVTFPSRGRIYDRNGEILAANTDAYAVGIIQLNIADNNYGNVVAAAARLTGRSTSSINADLQAVPPGWYVPVGETTAVDVQARYDYYTSLSGLELSPYTARYYFDGGVAPQVLGYVLAISEDQMDEYRRQGYPQDARVGQAGLEGWGEEYLAGTPSASLYVVSPTGSIITRIARSDPEQAQNLTTTLDLNLQLAAQRTLEGLRGAIVVMERDTGRILAMASSPSYDPNLFEPGNRNSQELLADILNDGTNRLLNRATQGVYPLGSVSKIITMSAALESGLYTADTMYDCQYYFTELPGDPLEDWTLAHEIAPSGELNLMEGLMRSCNPYFYHIGLDLYRRAGATDLADMARAFGLSTATGIEQVAESEGSITNPPDENAAVQMGIGQGDMLVTPLQVCDFVAAVGNGGTLWRPQVIEQIAPTDGAATYTFEPEVRGTLPLSAENLAIVQEAMRMVVEDRRGTAHRPLLGLNIPVYGKTGTASNPFGDSHAWFAGYTDSVSGTPNIAVAVIVENGGEGSEVAAPIFRRMVEVYFGYTSLTLLPWESSLYVTRTPTPNVTNTPGPLPTDTPSP